MKKLILLAALLMPAAQADMIHKMTSSTQLTVDGAYTVAERGATSYSVSGSNIESADVDGYINSIPTAEASQTVNGVNFSYTSPTLEGIPRWKIVNSSQPFSLVESVISPGLDTITTINRTINTTTTTTVETTFGQ